MPTLTWKLDDPNYCDGCPCHYIDFLERVYKMHGCTVDYYIDVERASTSKKRPKKCREELGE